MSIITSYTYTGDGTTASYAVPFPYSLRSDVTVTVNDEAPTTVTWLSPSMVQISPTPISGAKVQLKRRTNIETAIATFQAGSLKSSDINKAIRQILYALQEASLAEDISEVHSILDSVITARDVVLAAQASVLGVAGNLGAAEIYRNYAEAQAANISVNRKTLAILGVNEAGDAYDIITLKRRVGPQPEGAHIRSSDRFLPTGTTDATNGGYWEITNRVISPRMIGCVGDGVTNDWDKMYWADRFCALNGKQLLIDAVYRIATNPLVFTSSPEFVPGGRIKADGVLVTFNKGFEAPLHHQVFDFGASGLVRNKVFTKRVTPHMFGGIGDGSTDCSVAINRALSILAEEQGGVLYLPYTADFYKVTGGLTVNHSNITIEGDGRGSTIGGFGNFNTLVFNGTWGAGQLYGNVLKSLRFASYGKTGGYDIYANNTAQMLVEDVFVDMPYSGSRFHNFNDLNIIRSRFAGVQQSGGITLHLTGGGSGDPGRADLVHCHSVVLSGDSPTDNSTPARDKHGLVIDGSVFTISAEKLYLTAINGVGLWTRNTIGAAIEPEFLTIRGLESDYNANCAVYFQAGKRLYLTDPMLHGSWQSSNIIIGAGCQSGAIKGGQLTGAGHHGVQVSGEAFVIEGVMATGNSNPGRGSTGYGVGCGVYIGNGSDNTVVKGVIAGIAQHNGWQAHGIAADGNAENVSIVGNICSYNAVSGIRSSTGTAVSRVVASNIGSVTS